MKENVWVSVPFDDASSSQKEPGQISQFPKQFCNYSKVFFPTLEMILAQQAACAETTLLALSVTTNEPSVCWKSLHPSPPFTLVLSLPLPAETVVQLSPDEATEGTMSSEALPLIFEPLEDTVSERGSLQPPADSDGPSRALTPPIPDWTSPWQSSGTERLEPTALSGPSASPRRAGGELGIHPGDALSFSWITPLIVCSSGAVKMLKLEAELPTGGPTSASDQRAASALPGTSHQHKARPGLEAMESEGKRELARTQFRFLDYLCFASHRGSWWGWRGRELWRIAGRWERRGRHGDAGIVLIAASGLHLSSASCLGSTQPGPE